MSVLITGAGGLLGSHLTAAFARDTHVVAVDRRPWWGDVPAESAAGDLLEPGWIEDLLASARPELVVHCAAMVDVDACEQAPDRADLINAQLTRRIARALPAGAVLVYISTDGLFDGRQPWVDERVAPNPRTAYGRSKLHGEREVRAATDDHLILRTNFFGWSSGRKKTSAEWAFDALEQRTPVTMFDDFYFTPLYVVEFTRALRALLERRARGVVHVGGADRVTKYTFASMLAEAAGFDTSSLRRGSMRDANLLADRPADMSLASNRLTALTGLAPSSLQDGIRQFVADRQRPLSARVS